VLNGSISSVDAQGHGHWVRPDASASNPVLPETFPNPNLNKAVVLLMGKEECLLGGYQGEQCPHV